MNLSQSELTNQNNHEVLERAFPSIEEDVTGILASFQHLRFAMRLDGINSPRIGLRFFAERDDEPATKMFAGWMDINIESTPFRDGDIQTVKRLMPGLRKKWPQLKFQLFPPAWDEVEKQGRGVYFNVYVR